MIMDIAAVIVFAGILGALWFNYRLEKATIKLRRELDDQVRRAMEDDLRRP